MPCGYDVLSDLNNRVSEFVKSRLQAFGNDMVPVFPNNSSPMVYRGGLSELPGVGTTADKQLYNGAAPASILYTSKTNMVANWENYLKALESSGQN